MPFRDLTDAQQTAQTAIRAALVGAGGSPKTGEPGSARWRPARNTRQWCMAAGRDHAPPSAIPVREERMEQRSALATHLAMPCLPSCLSWMWTSMGTTRRYWTVRPPRDGKLTDNEIAKHLLAAVPHELHRDEEAEQDALEELREKGIEEYDPRAFARNARGQDSYSKKSRARNLDALRSPIGEEPRVAHGQLAAGSRANTTTTTTRCRAARARQQHAMQVARLPKAPAIRRDLTASRNVLLDRQEPPASTLPRPCGPGTTWNSAQRMEDPVPCRADSSVSKVRGQRGAVRDLRR